MNTTILDIPHVVTSITRTLSFSDLLSCVLINHAWHDAVVPELYRDLITFRSSITRERIRVVSCYHHYFCTFPQRQALFKHSHHIRALTCRGNRILGVLADIDCTNLVEINFLVEKRRYRTTDRDPALTIPILGLVNLAKLISRNVNLRAVSIEDLVVTTELDLKELKTFVDFLGGFPMISCFYLAGNCMLKSELKEPLQAIWDQRLAAIDSSTIVSLRIKQPAGVTRSRRGPPLPKESDKLNKWPGRKGAKPVSNFDSEWYFPRGRWEEKGPRYNPAYALRSPSCGELAVLENNGVLEVCLPSLIFEDSIGSLINRFPGIRRLQTAALHCQEDKLFLEALPGNLPNLCDIDLQVYTLNNDQLERFLNDPHMTLSSVSLRQTLTIRRRASSPLHILPGGALNHRNYLHDVIVNLNVGKTTLTMTQLCQLLGQCRNLLNLKVLGAVITEQDGTRTHASWVCSLRVLNLGLYIEGTRCNMGKWESRNMSSVDNVRRSTAATHRVAPLFMKQLGLQTDLKKLELHFNQMCSPTTSPFLRLDIDPEQGLGQLSKLAELVSFGATGIKHLVGQQAIEWMASHWPRLRTLALSSMSTKEGGSLVLDTTGQLIQPQFWRWLPHLRVRAGYEWYTCPCCNEAPVR